MEFKILTSDELDKLSNKERRDYLKKKKEYDNQKLIEDTLESAKEEEIQAKIEIKPEVSNEVLEKKEVLPDKNNEEKKAEKALAKEKKEKAEVNNTSKIGRPKGRPSSKISINVPSEYIDYIEIASGIKYRGNTSSYISALIEKDIEENKTIYNQIKKLKNN